MRETNLLYERYRFFERCQKSHETIIEYAEEIQRLAKCCAFDVLEQSLIRDRVIFGIKDKKMKSQIIKKGGDPTLDETIVLCEYINGRPEPRTERNRRKVNELDNTANEGKTICNMVSVSTIK